MVIDFDTLASSGAQQIAVEPLPTSTTSLPSKVRRSSRSKVWTSSPRNSSAPGNFGMCGAEK
jgi:hypothetical protein